MGLFDRRSKSARGESTKVAVLEGDGSFSYGGVVGESFYRDSLLGVIERASEDEREIGEFKCRATILADPNNRYDAKAVAVLLGEDLVGYVVRDQTDLFHEVFRQLGQKGYSDEGFLCDAVICWSGEPEVSPIGIRLDLVLGSGENDLGRL